MHRNPENTDSAQIKSPCELAAMLGQLSRDERLRVEGIIIGLHDRNCEDEIIGAESGSVQPPESSKAGRPGV